MNKSMGKLFIVSAPTGAGKTTVAKTVLTKLETQIPLSKVITYTTRPPRPQEINGKDYHFVTIDDFVSKKNTGFFLETTVYDGHWYGSPKSIIAELKTGKSFLLVTDRPGAKTIKSQVPDAVLIWLDVPSKEVLLERLGHRTSANQQERQHRLALAQREIDQEKTKRFFTHHVMNNTLDDAVHQIIKIITNAIHPDKTRTSQG